jgi:signal transduction histidine kinase
VTAPTPLSSGAGPAAQDAGRYRQGQRIGPDELRTLFLFEKLAPDQLDWIAERTRVELHPAHTMVYTEGEEATCFFVLLSGTVAMSRHVREDDVEVNRTSMRGVYAGATQSFTPQPDGAPQRYPGSLRAVTDVAMIALPAAEFAVRLREWFPLAMHLIEGMLIGIRTSQAVVGQREQLMSLGQMTAGLTHELNNPAAAAVRATSALRERVAGMRHKLAMLAGSEIDGDALKQLTALQEDAVAHVREAATGVPLSPLESGDREDEFGEWLEDHGVRGAWELAPVFVAAGVTPRWMEQLPSITANSEDLNGSVRWLAYSVETEMLMGEIEEATQRISTLVGAAKNYSHMDRSAHEWVDVHEGLDSTLVMLGHRLRGVKVVKDYDRTLPKVLAFPGELNQVWTNLIDNAAGAMAGSGTLTVRTTAEETGDCLLVEVVDTGPGVPQELQRRIFEPFFTTKGVGEGTGLGLDISWRIVVNRHGGDLRVVSVPGDTRFQVRLPLHEAP